MGFWARDPPTVPLSANHKNGSNIFVVVGRGGGGGTACGRRCVDSKHSQTTPATTSTTPNTPTIGRRYRANGTSRHIQHSPGKPTTGLRERGNDTSGSTGRSGRQKAATRRNMRREERVTVQGTVKEQRPDGMSHRGLGYLSLSDTWRVTDGNGTWGG